MKVQPSSNVATKTAAPEKKEEKEQPTLRSTITRKYIGKLSREVDDSHEAFNKKRTVDNLHVDIKGESAKVMHLTELRYGHKDADLKFAERALSHLESLPPKERPDVVVVSGLIFGNYQNREKNNRRVKTMSVNKQFGKAKEFIERLQKIGMTVIYNKSDDDQKIIEDYTYDAVKILEGEARKNGQDWPTSWAAFDQAKRSHLWEGAYEFEWDVVFEYMLRCGRRLSTKEEVQRDTELPENEVAEEYLLLLDAHKKLERREELTPLQREVLEVENIPYKGRPEDKLIVTDDYNVELKTKGKKTNISGRHEFRQTPTSMVKDPTKSARAIISQMEASGKGSKDALFIENAQQSVGVMHGNTLITSTPGMTTYNPDSSSFARVQSDKAERIAKCREELNFAGIQEVEFHDDGRISVHLMNDTLMNLAAKTEEPHAAIFFSDWQTGSVTARPDLAAKAMDYVLHSVLMKQKGMLFMNGDIIQGRNYPEMPNENPNMGLITIDNQQEFVYTMLKEILEKMPDKAKNNLQGVHITPGNHEWNSGHERHGSTHSMFLKVAFNEASNKTFKTILHSYDTMMAGTNHCKSYTAVAELAAHKILAQHIMMERGGKGSGGLPINQFFDMVSSSTGPLMKELNLMGAGHYHQPSYMMTNNKIGLINGSLAGLSGYEWWRGYNPVLGTSIVHLGGNRPAEIEFLTPEFLYNYQCKGAYSDSNLERKGFTTDRSFDPNKNGFGKIFVPTGQQFERMPQSAIQKRLWDIVDHILWDSSVSLY
ncbi:MAG: hypothetical protein HY094_05695 [Candidatus Melainabacteria bacterium]|nr:hypothetical protein [Candidatus Melainabacteria bacterium]